MISAPRGFFKARAVGRPYSGRVVDTRTQNALGRFPFTSGLLVLLVAVFLAEELRGGSTETRVLIEMGANFPPLVLAGEWWRMLTAVLLHIGFLHLLVNGWALWQLGRLSEVTFGGATTLALFVFTGLTGSALTLLQVKVSAGASGALFGLEGALLSFFLRHRERLTPAGKGLLKQLLVWSLFMLVYSVAVPGIDLLGHLGGFAGGLAVGWALPPARARTGRIARLAAVVATLALVAAGAEAALATRFEERTGANGLSLLLPKSWSVADEDGALVARDAIGASKVVVDRLPASNPAEALDQALGEGGAGIELGAQREVEGGWTRRTFVARKGQESESAGFAQARCEDGSCLLVLAVTPGSLYADRFPTLERIAASARSPRTDVR